MTASASSVTKGESLLDTVRTLQAIGADMVVMRHPQSGAPWVVADQVDAAIVNGGDGWHAHPTQALLDLYTMRERLGRIAGLKVDHPRRRAAQPGRALGHLGPRARWAPR